jgi:hypothetical protein
MVGLTKRLQLKIARTTDQLWALKPGFSNDQMNLRGATSLELDRYQFSLHFI